MAKVMLTGGAGFIGAQVARELIAGGHEVVILDSFVQYVSPLKSAYQIFLKDRLQDIESKVVIERGDTRHRGDVAHFVERHRPERIIHLAALPLADLSNRYPEEALSSILNGTVNMLEVIRESDFVKRFVYASSSMIYGDFTQEPVDEDHPKAPKDVYGGTKLAGEIMTEAYGRRFGIEYAIVRPASVYGPTDVNARVTQIFVENAIQGKPLMLHDGGSARLDFTFVEDTAHGFVLAAFEDKARNEIFNITRGEGRSLKELADILKKSFPNLKTTEGKPDVFRPKRGSLSIAKAKKLLGFKPRYSLEEGMAKYIAHCKSKFK